MNKPLVVGYKGEIGSFILNGLLRIMPKALDIWCVDVNETAEEVTERIKQSDVIFLCVPIRDTVNWISEHQEFLKGKLIIEQCSLKEGVCNNMGVQQFDVRSMHILFRPSVTPNLEDRKVGLIKGQFDANMASDIAAITQAEVVWYQDVESHDREMAIQQALTHRTLMVLGEILSSCKGSTYVSKKVLELSNRIQEGDAELYGMIQDNKYLPGELEKLMEGFENFDIDKYMAG
jgi:prephenate dehydrogenase